MAFILIQKPMCDELMRGKRRDMGNDYGTGEEKGGSSCT
jgi:hypothetical protein